MLHLTRRIISDSSEHVCITTCCIMKILTDLFVYIERFITLDEPTRVLMESLVQPGFLQKGELFIEEGRTCNHLLFFSEGYFRFFHPDEEGREITSDFYFSPGFVTSFTSLITGNPSMVNVQAMEPMDVLLFRKEYPEMC